MKKANRNGIDYCTVPGWDARCSLAHGFFTRRGGISPAPYDSLNTGPRGGDTPAHVRKNLERIARALSIPAKRILCPAQVHGDRIHRVSGAEPSIFGTEPPLEGDGVITAERGLYLGILTADCVPVLFLDPERCVVGAVHAGWRGTAKGIAGKAVRRMRVEFGCEPSDIHVAIGPAVGPCCYEVGEDVARAFPEEDRKMRPFFRPEGPGLWKMNLAGLNRHQVTRAGVREANVWISSLCTCCRKDLFFSVRADGEPTGRQIALIGLRPGP